LTTYGEILLESKFFLPARVGILDLTINKLNTSVRKNKMIRRAFYFSTIYKQRLFRGRFNFLFGSSFAPYTFLKNSIVTKIAIAPITSQILNYYGDASLTLVSASKTMNLCSNLYRTKNFSFSTYYY